MFIQVEKLHAIFFVPHAVGDKRKITQPEPSRCLFPSNRIDIYIGNIDLLVKNSLFFFM